MATAAAKAWCESGNDLDFIRILHAHMRFVGELLIAAEDAAVRNDIYEQAKQYGLNTDKTRWIIGFLLEAGLLEETQYLHIKTTPLGLKLAAELPLSEAAPEAAREKDTDPASQKEAVSGDAVDHDADAVFDDLRTAAKDPTAAGKAAGVAFEEAIAAVFRCMGFDAKRIGGAGDTDVVVRWKDDEGKTIVAIVDGKSKSSGTVTHSDISDVAIETHKEKNNADFVAGQRSVFSGKCNLFPRGRAAECQPVTCVGGCDRKRTRVIISGIESKTKTKTHILGIPYGIILLTQNRKSCSYRNLRYGSKRIVGIL